MNACSFNVIFLSPVLFPQADDPLPRGSGLATNDPGDAGLVVVGTESIGPVSLESR